MTAYARFLVRSAAGSALLLALASSPASAQAPASPAPTTAQTTFLEAAFAQVVQGREVWVTTSNGSRQKVRVVGVAPTGLAVTATSGQGQTIRFEDIARVQKVSHRLRTHTLIGLGVGAGIGLMGLAACGGDGGCAGPWFLFYTGAGVGIGALNGAIKNRVNRDDDLIYDAGLRPTARLSLAPILSPTKMGVAVSVRF